MMIIQLGYLTNPTMHLPHIPQYTIRNRNMHITVLNGALWNMGHVHYGICELGQFNGAYAHVYV